MFLKVGEKVVNLKNVSNINIIPGSFRIVFNMNYSVQIFSKRQSKLISDYVYLDFDNSIDMQYALFHIYSNEYFDENFIEGNTDSTYINKNEISSIKFEESKLRIIFNLSHNVNFTTGDEQKMTSEFVYVNFKDYSDFTKYNAYLKETLNY